MCPAEVHYKSYPTVGACGIDCGLCPRYHARTGSRCPGCAPSGFLEIGGQWCKMTRCGVRDCGFETCAECAEFPCYRFDGWNVGDSFVSHLNSIANLYAIKEHGLTSFVEQQQKRIELLEAMISEFDEGRSKSYCCLAATLLPLEVVEETVARARRDVVDLGIPELDRKGRARVLHSLIDEVATRLGVSLRLRKSEKPSA